jgi:hypothetical protein
MKILSLSLVAALAFGLQASAQTMVAPGSIKMGKVSPAVVKTPEYNLTSGPTKRSKLGEWLEVEVEFETKPEDIDELTFNYTIMIENKLLTGQVTHVNIPKGREHFSVVYIAPRTLEKLTGGRLTSASIQNVWVTCERQGMKLDVAAYKPGPIPNLPQTTGLILNKDETPFAPLFYDRYEPIKKTR